MQTWGTRQRLQGGCAHWKNGEEGKESKRSKEGSKAQHVTERHIHRIKTISPLSLNMYRWGLPPPLLKLGVSVGNL